MIDKDGSVYSYNGPNDIVGHASKANRGYIGISYISGGALGPTNESQIQASIALLKVLRRDYGIEKVSNHATIDKIIAKRGWKSDPFYAGEKSEANDWKIKNSQLDVISKETGLTPVKYNPVLTMLPILNNTYPSSILMDDIDLGD
jgi:N-acetyl-anhydromuramyl-L-alanine amidase AmpD